jgi:hypothetical protein
MREFAATEFCDFHDIGQGSNRPDAITLNGEFRFLSRRVRLSVARREDKDMPVLSESLRGRRPSKYILFKEM